MARTVVPLVAMALFGLICCGAVPSSAFAAAPTPSLVVETPEKVQAGHPIKITLAVKNASNIGGYETNLLFDKDRAEFSSLSQDKKDLSGSGRDVGSLDPVPIPQGVAVGAFSCPVENCARPQGSRDNDRGIAGTVELSTITVTPRVEGDIRFALRGTKAVDASGKMVRLRSTKKDFVVHVGPKGAGGSRSAPTTVPWRLGASSRAPSGEVSDLSGNGSVSNADTMDAAIAWTLLRESGDPCSGRSDSFGADVDRDGCVDVGDLQKIAADYGSTSGLPEEPSDVEARSRVAQLATATLGPLIDLLAPRPALAQEVSTFVVTAEGDSADASPGDGVCATSAGPCTLRAAIEEANLHTGPDTIAFSIPGTGVRTITLGSQLPSINDETGPTTIDGYTQPGSSPNTASLVSNAGVRVQITASTVHTRDGLIVTSSGNIVRGLSLYKLKRPVWLYGSGANSNKILGDFVGTDAAGNYSAGSRVAQADGIVMQAGASNNEVGGTSAADRNVVSGNANRGIVTFGEITKANRILNNIVGLGPKGDKKLANIKHGVDINGGSSFNEVGGSLPNERNVVSGNGGNGIEISHTTPTRQNRAVGNYIGTDVSGKTAPVYASNAEWGVNVEDGVNDSTVAGNVIGNSGKGGVRAGLLATGTVIQDNRIGTSVDGTSIPNSASGVQIDSGASGSRVGPGNVITNNRLDGIRVGSSESDNNTFTRNSTFSNRGLGIDLDPLGEPNPNDAGDADGGPNEQLNWPEIGAATLTKVTGVACAGCTVEVFVADSGAGAFGEGRTMLGSSLAGEDGNFSVAVDGLAEGQYVTSTATDKAGNTSEFSLNRVVSEASDTVPPQTNIDSGPEGPVASSSATFVFSSSEPASTFECRVDGSAFERCAAPKEYANLAEGTHDFEVRATDAAGNVDDTPARRSWTVDTVAPATQPPEQGFVTGSTLGASAVPVDVVWSGSDEGSGLAEYRLQESINGGPFGAVALASPTSTKKTRMLSPGDAYQFRVQASDNVGNIGDWSNGPQFVVDAFQETSADISYVGTWTHEASNSAFGGGLTHSTAKASTARVDFFGSSVAWVAPRGADRGKAEVWVDGVKVKTVDLYSSTQQPQKMVFTQSWAVPGSHTLEVRTLGTENAASAGTRVDVDAFVALR